jgi:hypothetical protein
MYASRTLPNGKREIKRRCGSCNFAWVLNVADYKPLDRKKPVKLTAEQVKIMLTDFSLTQAQAAERFGCNRDLVAKVRRGRSYAGVHPEIPRWPADKSAALFCNTCIHWCGAKCGMDFPEPKVTGMSFANECAVYQELLQPGAGGAEAGEN